VLVTGWLAALRLGPGAGNLEGAGFWGRRGWRGRLRRAWDGDGRKGKGDGDANRQKDEEGRSRGFMEGIGNYVFVLWRRVDCV
jgi:hypothetical protein